MGVAGFQPGSIAKFKESGSGSRFSTYTVLGTQLLRQGCAHDHAALAGGSREVSLTALAARRRQGCIDGIGLELDRAMGGMGAAYGGRRGTHLGCEQPS